MEVISKSALRKRGHIKVLFFVGIFYTEVLGAAELPELNAKLAMCEGTFSYATQYFQISGDVGAAQNLLMRYSSAAATSLWINRNSSGVIPAGRVAAIKKMRLGLKARYDGNIKTLLEDLGYCDSVLVQGRRKASEMGGVWDGQSLASLEKLIAAETKSRLNLQ